ncbi:MAG: 50S ribosomal protein L21e [Nanoarchaeota archaeon]|nr:50S ribosomal protein L21e [Nanoarchaeota archaeon]
MVREKKIRTRGKLQLSKYFQEFKEGASVAVIREPSVNFSFPRTLQGMTGVVESKRGGAYLVKINTQGKEKKFLIHPIHLKKIKQI